MRRSPSPASSASSGPCAPPAPHATPLQRGELREADWWFQEACGATADDTAGFPPGLPEMPGWYRVVPAVLGQWSSRENAQPTTALADDRLVVRTNSGDADFDGIAGRPGPSLANRIEELAGHN